MWSAVARSRTPGVLVTVTPAAAAASRSMLSKPTATLAMTFSCGPAAASRSASTCSVRVMTAAPAPAMPASSSARLGGASASDPDRGAQRVQVLHGTVGEQPGHIDQPVDVAVMFSFVVADRVGVAGSSCDGHSW